MDIEIERRALLQMLGLGLVGGGVLTDSLVAFAADTVLTSPIGWPSDVTTWDPNQRFTPDAQPIFKLVFDQPLDQDPELHLIPDWSPNGSRRPTARAWRSTSATT